MKTKVVVCAMLLGISEVTERASAQVNLVGTNYTQNFDNVSSGLPAGWSVRTNASVTSLGTAAGFVTNSISWSSSSGQFANFASTTNNDGSSFLGSETATAQTSATNRCAGIRQTGTFGDPEAAIVLHIQNTLGLANFQITADFNMLNVQGRSTTWTIDYGIGTNPVSFTPAGTFTDPGVFGTSTKTFSFGTALDNQSQNVWIRLVSLTGSTGSGSRDTFGIDNFALSYGAYVANAPIPLHIRLAETNAILTWSNSSFVLQGAGSITGAYTDIPGATSPYTNPATGSERYFRLRAN